LSKIKDFYKNNHENFQLGLIFIDNISLSLTGEDEKLLKGPIITSFLKKLKKTAIIF